MRLNKERAWELFFYWRDCLRRYVVKHALSVTLVALLGVIIMAWQLFVVVVFGG